MSQQERHQVWLGLGSNLGHRACNLAQALRRLGERVAIEATSPIYETEPWGVTDQPCFLNLTCSGRTDLGPRELLAFVKGIEQDMGRTESVRYGPRLIDIDILFYDDLILQKGDLVIPHPRLHERAFVLAPLADLAPELVHPVLGRTVADLLGTVDTDGVRRLDQKES